MTRKTMAGLGLVMIAGLGAMALFSFWKENWAADQPPGAVERFLARWLLSGSRTVPEIPNPLPPSETNLARGRSLYEKQCAFCHGLDGAGPGDSGVQFYPPVPSLVPPQNPLSDAQMHFVIQRGIRYTAMPSFAKALTEEEIWAVVLWLRHLNQPPAARRGTEPPPLAAP
ncbi:MAG TPA: cytochrome c [Terriglobia bacterium]|nr:cytochrome c [Terriglobia bacterium]